MKKAFPPALRKYPAPLLLCCVMAAWLWSPCGLLGKDFLPIPGKDLLPRKDAQSYLVSGVKAYQSGALDTAIEDFTKAIELDPSLVGAYDARATVRFQMKDYSDAIRDCDTVLGITHDDEHVYLIKGLCRYYLHDDQGALKPLNTAVSMNTNDPIARIGRGTILAEFRRWDDARADFTKAVELDPDNGMAYYGRAAAELLLKEYEKSLADVSDALNLLDNDTLISAAYGLRADIKARLKDKAGALADANARIKIDSSDDKAYVSRALAEGMSDDFSGASNDLQIAIQINPTNSDIYLCRAMVEGKSGNFQAAIADYNRGLLDATEAFQGADAYEAIGYAHAEMGQWQPALEAFRKANAFNAPPDDVPFQVFLVESRLGQADQAKKDLAAYIQSISAAKARDWPASVSHFLAGTLNEADFIAQATTTAKRPTDIPGQLGDAWYYAGMQHLLAGDKAGAWERFKKSLKVGDDDDENYTMARAILGVEMPSAVSHQPLTQPPGEAGK